MLFLTLRVVLSNDLVLDSSVLLVTVVRESQLYAGKTIDQPSMFISGSSDWGTYQGPGSFERMQQSACTDMRAVHLVDGAGHWVQQEQAEETSRLLLEFLAGLI